jgi:hypothetical protein
MKPPSLVGAAARAAALLAIALAAYALWIGAPRARDNGQWNDVPDTIRQWFKGVRSPFGMPCCDIADGHRTTWRGDKDGGYEVPIDGAWRRVPPEAVVYGAGNPTGEAIVWYVRQGADTYYIRCFVPGDGV